jgi:hypothetical protein
LFLGFQTIRKEWWKWKNNYNKYHNISYYYYFTCK